MLAVGEMQDAMELVFLLFLLLALGEEEMSCARAGDGLNVPLQVTR